MSDKIISKPSNPTFRKRFDEIFRRAGKEKNPPQAVYGYSKKAEPKVDPAKVAH